MTDSTTGGTAIRAGETAKRPRTRTQSVLLFLRDILIIFLIAVLVSFLIKTFLIRSFWIPSESMEDTLMVNDRIIVNELVPHVVPLKHGDVVVFQDPGGWLDGEQPVQRPVSSNPIAKGVNDFLVFIGLSSEDTDDHLVKRVIGLPGDHVVCCNTLNQITVNGVPIKEPYIVSSTTQLAAGDKFDVTVPKGDVWVLGDNRHNSQDSSRNQNLPGKGFVPIKDVVGRAFVVSWPFDRWSWLSDYPQVWRGVEDDKGSSK